MLVGKQDMQSFYIQDVIIYGSLIVILSMCFDSVCNDGQVNLVLIYDNFKFGYDYCVQIYFGWLLWLLVFWIVMLNLVFFVDYIEIW